ncbi:MAG: hypothetical protein A2268_09985 [Candidatus Raymondbacteria bacterium RifOxyA12_full_50_37]|uniref:UmuC domain-containing protein n=1 Tax=Candidatus Raymondbacteria bacterium RIFOXYD12_FULL_49_13 TaxID=1817890 RepID=A0A1F7F422_UNCRA|nr:MAG: hypothetical protein A2268_09985 [Candidatus Raymondbacteria bacterium RifOxyA12_full_50_37]OGJ93833.1 MAG: hypothetical protein A2248_06315 [Candidatus Raymondbacteria bacterium RIFOXYA2_FULL_49_16]OGJ97330.1 MAG: hypothetical protein A2487_16515 [Candidatus Raymondbacteria bacterium RifOxyC12_full_50_8]OGJ98300.1 MAG: hypothetical protein A2453_00860 [Candidatus Raymondbacteria bacterium RIFOXYC2_FULL_50_21]OGK01399.1 MAG: hypothetical protein A2519_14915 [Candidatus Raymondbacteria b
MPEFPAQVLASWNPGMRKQPFVVVRQSVDSHKSMVISVSPHASHMGVHAGMPVRMVRKRFRNLEIVQENKEQEKSALLELESLLRAYVPEHAVRVHAAGIVVDLSGMDRLHPEGMEAFSRVILDVIIRSLNFTDVRAGLAVSLFVSRLCAKTAGPGEIKVCVPGREQAELLRIPVSYLPGLSVTARNRLLDYNLTTIGHVQKLDFYFLESRFGEEGGRIYHMVRGRDMEPAAQDRKKAVCEVSKTFERNTNDSASIRVSIRYIADELAMRLRVRRSCARSLTCSVRFSDNKTAQRTARLPEPTAAFIRLHDTAQELFNLLYFRRVALSRISLVAGNLEPDNGQTGLFVTREELKMEAAAKAIDRVRKKMGFEAVLNASVIPHATRTI